MIYKRGDMWWMDRTIEGRRFREPLNTDNQADARAREDERVAAIRSGAAAPSAMITLSRAVEKYLSLQEGTVADGTIETEKHLAKPLLSFFGSAKLRSIGPELVQEYRNERLNDVSAGTVNQEVALLKRVLKRSKVEIEIKPLKHEADNGRALTVEDKARLFSLAASNPAWRRAFLAARLAASTGMRSSELRGILWRDVGTDSITVRKSKTDAGRGRAIPLNEASRSALQELASEYDVRSEFPVVPFKSWRSAWESLRDAAVLPGLHFHHLRHGVATELAEGGATDQTIMAILGHMSPEMVKHYSHIRMEAKKKAMKGVGI